MGGMERASVNIANGISKLGYNVAYISLFNQSKFFLLDSKIKLIEPQSFNIDSLSIFKTIKWIRKTVKQINPDRIIVLNKFYSAIVLLALYRTEYKVFISERSSPLYDWGLKINFFNKIIFSIKKPSGIIAQTSVAAKFQKKYYGNSIPIEVIPNVLRHVTSFPEIKREKIILAVGRLSDPLKGFDQLIEVFAQVSVPSWKLVFAGGDVCKTNLKKRAKELKVLNRIIFLGEVREIDLVYAKSSIFVIPSRSEGFPNALCEAMGSGLPCISFDFVAGPRDIIKHNENGFLVENGNIHAMAKKIEYLIGNEPERNRVGTNALAISQRLNEKIIVEQIRDFIFHKKQSS